MEFGLFSSRSLMMDRTFLDSGLSSSGRLDWNKVKKKKKVNITILQDVKLVSAFDPLKEHY